MKESVTKFDFEAAFKALDEIDVPSSDKGIKANRPALTEIFSRKSKFDSLFEEYYDIGSSEELGQAKEDREAEVAKAKLERIEKIVDLDADSPEDLLTSYVGKYIIQCPQCMTLFYKNQEDVVESEDDPNTVNVSEVCQHCGNESGYTLVGKVGEATAEDTSSEFDLGEMSAEEELPAEEPTEENVEEGTDEAADDMGDLDALDLDLDLDEPAEEEKTEESFTAHTGETLVEDVQDDKELDAKLDAHNEYIAYLRATLAEEEKALENAANEQIKAAIQRRIDAFKIDLENALPDAVKAEVPVDEVVEESSEEVAELEDTAVEETVAQEESYEANAESTTLTEGLTEEADLDVSADEFEELIKSPEFQKPISDAAVRAMLNTENDESEDVKEAISTYKCDDCGFEIDLDDEEFDGKCPHCGEHHGFYKLEEGVFDALARMFKNRAAMAEWVLANAKKDYTNIKTDAKGKLVADPANQKYKCFVVIGFKNKFNDGSDITACPTTAEFKKLVIGRDPEAKLKYAEAENIATGWSKIADNGPAAVFMANEANDANATFVCQYFKGALDKKSDTLAGLLKEVKDNLDGGKKMSKGNAGVVDTKKLPASKIAKDMQIKGKDGKVLTVTNVSDSDIGKQITYELDGATKFFQVPDGAELEVISTSIKTESLETIMSNVEELHEASLEKLIADSLIESYGNVAGFRLTSSEYLDESLKVNGTVYFTSGATRKLTYAFSEAYSENGKVKLCGLNEKLGLDKRFTITGKIDETNKTFITESFIRNK